MSLMRRNDYDPFRNMRRMMNRMQAMMDGSLLNPDWNIIGDDNTLAIDMSSNDKEIVIRTAMPGLREEDIKIDVQGNMLRISGESSEERSDDHGIYHIREMRYGKFARSVRLPDEVNVDKADATLENGVLVVTLPKTKPNPIKQIAVKAKKLLVGKNENTNK